MRSPFVWGRDPFLDGCPDGMGKRGWDGISDLPCDVNLAPAPLVVRRESLQGRCLPMRDRAIERGVKVPTFLRFEELGPDSD
jgi:hypothetical protein